MRRALLLLSAAALLACQPQAPATHSNIDIAAQDFVRLALAFGAHDVNYVDAYTGPSSIQDEVLANPMSLDEIEATAAALSETLSSVKGANPDRLTLLRGDVLALQTRLAMAKGEIFSFDEETRRIYGAVAPHYTLAQFEAALKVEASAGDIPEPVVIPKDKIKPVMEAAIAECRARTLDHYDLPKTERFDMEFVTGKSWSAYNWYKGDYRSVIQINLDQPIYFHKALDLGCHEGYPGHHVFNVLAERDRIKKNGWMEGTVVPLYSPSGPLMEGSGNYGLELAFPGSEKAKFEREVLYPLAGLKPAASRAPDSAAVEDAKRVLAYSGIHAAREYLDGRISREDAVEFLMKFEHMKRPRAEQRVDFFDTYRGYTINYTLGQHVIGDYVEAKSEQGEDPWVTFKYILDTPMTLESLQAE